MNHYFDNKQIGANKGINLNCYFSHIAHICQIFILILLFKSCFMNIDKIEFLYKAQLNDLLKTIGKQ